MRSVDQTEGHAGRDAQLISAHVHSWICSQMQNRLLSLELVVRAACSHVQFPCAREGLLGLSCLQPRATHRTLNPEVSTSSISTGSSIRSSSQAVVVTSQGPPNSWDHMTKAIPH